MNVGRDLAFSGFHLLVEEGAVFPMEVLRRSSDSARANWVFDSTLPAFSSIIFNEVILEINPCSCFVVEFWQGYLVGIPFQCFGELGEGGVGEGGVGASHGVRAAAGAVEVGCQFLGGRPC